MNGDEINEECTELINRAQEFLSNGGLFNPEHMDSAQMGQLIHEMRHHLPVIREAQFRLSAALRDAISTYSDRECVLVTTERQEAWSDVLEQWGMSDKD